MSEAFRKLSENLPVRRSPDGLAFPTDPKKVKAWIETLPRANQAATNRQLVDALESLRDVRLEGGQRLAIFETLRPVLLEALQALSQQAQGGTIPLPLAKAKAIEQLQVFEGDLAQAYRMAAVELCAPQGAIPFLKGGTVAQALERAIYHQSRRLMHAYFLYQEPHAGIWHELHALMNFARHSKIDDKAVEEPAEKMSLSVHQLYLQALLLALSNPYRFSQKEQADLWHLCRDLAPHLGLHADRRSDDQFAIPLDGDEGPGYIAEERAVAHGEVLWLDLAALRAAFEGPLEITASGPVQIRFRSGKSVHSTAELLRRLRGGWGTAATRKNQRLAAGHSLDAVIGLSNVHFHYAERVDFDTFVRQTGLAEVGNERDRATWAHAGLDAGRVPVFRAEVLDQSLGGYRIRWPRDESVRARVGELCGLAVAGVDDDRQWMLGVIRWLRYATDGSVDAGIELLARRARPVAVRSMDPPVGQKPTMRGIQFEPVRNKAEGRLRFVVPSLLEAQQGTIEVIRHQDPNDDAFDMPMREQCRRLQALENAGDYLIVEADTESGEAA